MISTDMLVHASKTSVAKDESADHYLRRLTHLTLTNKKLTGIANLELCRNLKVLYLYGNRIQTIENLAFASQLTQLHLQDNRITRMEGLDALVNLEKLCLEGNQICRLEGLEHCSKLTELHLANQNVSTTGFALDDAASLATLSRCLRVLNLANCNVQRAAPLVALGRLEQLNLARNAISDMEDVFALVGGLRCLRDLNLTNNHVNATPKYRENTIIFSGAHLQVLDTKDIDAKQRAMMQSHLAFKHKKRMERGKGPIDPEVTMSLKPTVSIPMSKRLGGSGFDVLGSAISRPRSNNHDDHDDGL
ncbi:hypothetical protein SPRG_08340 [Saprolegnia parasitica CBS 223.65]|uniref:U2A'/phosphoprotein 32 family A C-terminal domain-containing protein n=1 Tax=Saprolegnia parasitica (strain CBS 223.65) TaxID=695850 RepID=A0A067C685_SAPPC|nr:hypothetical protein SPRG_08340 [Saprolegnia parasitica CBS 223.65]KDO26264.1 hypothetical protein SPRG_08340 [Saprolegnia parasitica CBS 223.65]|eukprot:XP_012202973.1 hypothetical protein SPRG_08340 [Saprolegnia parasitica CBS 223.65]